MRIRSFRSTLNECTTALRQGESVEACLSRYPKHAARLRPLLTLAQRVSQTPPTSPRPSAQRIAWDLVRQRAADLREGRRRPPATVTWLRPLAITASLLLALLAAGGGTVYAAQDSLPDSPLYRIKLATEDVRLWFVFDEAERAESLLDQSDTRTEEIIELVQQGKTVQANVLSALRDRNAKAASILESRPQETTLLARMRQQSQAQEELLLALWEEVSGSAHDEYAEVVATLHNTRLSGSASVAAIQPEDLAGGVLRISGPMEPLTEGLWLIGGVEVRVDQRTFGALALQAGDSAEVVAARGANGRLHALNLSTIESGQPESGTVVSGALEEVTDDEILVAGHRIAITSQTLLKLKLQQGQRVQITVSSGAGGAVASAVEPSDAEAGVTDEPTLVYEGTITGQVSADGETNQWVIGGQAFVITPATVVDAQAGAVKAGARAFVQAVSRENQLLAQRVIILAGDADSDDVHLTGVFQGSSAQLWSVSGLMVEAEEGMPAPEVGSLVAIDAERNGNRIVGRETTVLEPPGQDGLVRLQGLVASVDGSTWTVGFARVQVGKDTKIFGDAIAGTRALIWSREAADGTLQAAYVRILDQRSIIPAEEP